MCDLVIGVVGSTIGGSAGAVVAERAIEDYAARGEVDMVLDDEASAIAAARRYLQYWTVGDQGDGEVSPTHEKIGTIVPDNRRRPYDMRKLIAAFADEDSVLELGRRWAPSMVTSLARLGGRAIGIFANQPFSPRAGAIDSDAADKAARVVELCDAYELPLVSFVDASSTIRAIWSDRTRRPRASPGIMRGRCRPFTTAACPSTRFRSERRTASDPMRCPATARPV
jgi:hypothetical protein